jgi:hypothetical protein
MKSAWKAGWVVAGMAEVHLSEVFLKKAGPAHV